ncbi:MAG: hypothetical protein GYB65_06020, partial [Chloroflexi bacterium]|nr:hypothetical protein [Chloroflexota bacterium]
MRNPGRYIVMLLFLVVGMAQAPAGYAQGDGWPIVQQCIESVPSSRSLRAQWNFEGVIFSLTRDGVRAIRVDFPSSYFVALDDGTAFGSVGAFSPDGRWFAYPAGSTSFWVNSVGDNAYGVDEIRVVSTDPRAMMYRVPWNDYGIGPAAWWTLPRPEWIDNDTFVIAGSMAGGGGIIDAFNAEFLPWDRSASLTSLSHFSPDYTRAILQVHAEETSGVYDVDSDTTLASIPSRSDTVAWLPDSSGFVMEIWQDS